MFLFRPANEDMFFEENSHNNGLNPQQISQLADEEIKEAILCSICLENIEVGGLAKIIPGCLHKFHEQCIIPWLISNAICPYCRSDIRVD